MEGRQVMVTTLLCFSILQMLSLTLALVGVAQMPGAAALHLHCRRYRADMGDLSLTWASPRSSLLGFCVLI